MAGSLPQQPSSAAADPAAADPAAPARLGPATVETADDLARLLRGLRRREARQRGGPELTYRELAAKTGWSYAIIGQYLTGGTLPPTDRFDALIRLLGAQAAELGALATARDRVEERQRGRRRRGGDDDKATVPRQLPVDVTGFVGRGAELAALDDAAGPGRRPGDVAIVVLSGIPGVGKTSLAVNWAHRVARHFPDGQLYVNLHGFDETQVMSPTDALGRFLEALGIPATELPVDEEGRAALFRSTLADRRVLVLLDNARDADHVRRLLPATEGSVAVVTSRNQLVGLVATHAATPLTVEPLPHDDAERLLSHRLGSQRTVAEPEAVGRIIDRCGRLPLALAIVAAQARIRGPQFRLGTFADQLADPATHLDAFAGLDAATDIRRVFSWSRDALTADAARLLRFVGLHSGPHITVPAAASLAGVPIRRSAMALTELVAANLMTESAPGRYDMHDLLAAYAAELARDLDAATRRECLRRLLDHYLQTAFRAAVLVEPFRTPPPMPSPADAVSTVELTDSAAGMAWLRDEYPVLMATINDAWVATDLEQSERDAYTWRMAWCLGDFHLRHCFWQDQIVAQQAALAAATRLDDRPAQARSLNNLAGGCERLNRHEDARAYFGRALRLNRREGDIEGQAVNHANLAWLHGRQGRAGPALCHAQRSLELYRSLAHRDGYAFALTLVGENSRWLGDHQRALECLQEALAVNEELGDRRGQAESLEQLGHTHLALGEHGRAEACYRAALDLTRHLHDRDHEAAILSGLGDCFLADGRPAEAHAYWLSALSIVDGLDPYGADTIRAKLGQHTSFEA